MTSNELVYLEDVEPSRKTDVKNDATKTTASIATTIESNNQSTGTMKRQMSIGDMFSKASSKGSLSKRQKAEHGTSKLLARRSVSGLAPLNSVPLNLDAFRASLSEEARKLLALEIETMGKSWSVFFSSFSSQSDHPSFYRLKVLTDEIKKPYFITLKRWLATEGLAEDFSKTGYSKNKIFPPGMKFIVSDLMNSSTKPNLQRRKFIHGLTHHLGASGLSLLGKILIMRKARLYGVCVTLTGASMAAPDKLMVRDTIVQMLQPLLMFLGIPRLVFFGPKGCSATTFLEKCEQHHLNLRYDLL